MLLFTPDRLIEALQWKTRQVEQLDSASALAEIVMQLQWLFELPLVVEMLDHHEAQFDLKLHEYASLFDSSSKTIAACLIDLQGDPEVWSSAWAFDTKEVQEKTKNKVLASIDFYLQPPTDLEFSFTSSLDFHQHKRKYLKHLQTLEDAAESLREKLEGRQTRPEDQLGVLGVLIAAATQIREAFARFEFWREHSVPGAFNQLSILWDVSRMKSPRSLFGSNRAQINALRDMLLGKEGQPEPVGGTRSLVQLDVEQRPCSEITKFPPLMHPTLP